VVSLNRSINYLYSEEIIGIIVKKGRAAQKAKGEEVGDG
jgi:hypothetical protein